jgi:multidrug efflux pump subunit AcrB
VRSSARGASVYLRDVAQVIDTIREGKLCPTEWEERGYAQHCQARRRNLISTADGVKEVIASLQEKNELPQDLNVVFTGDQSKGTRTSFNELINTIIIGFVLGTIDLDVLYGVTNAFFVALSVPLSVFVAFLFLPLADAIVGGSVTLNFIVLFALLFGLGIIVRRCHCGDREHAPHL